MKSKQYPYEVYVLRKRVNLIQEKTGEWGRLFTYNLFTMDIYVFEKSKRKKLIYNIYIIY